MRVQHFSISAVLIALLWVVPAFAVLQVPIEIDGEFTDWAGVLTSSANTITDRAHFDSDPDAPGEAAFDLRKFAATWDATHLYLYWQCTTSDHDDNADAMVVAYIDLGYDGDMGPGDKVLLVAFRHGGLKNDLMMDYSSVAGPDPMLGDGNDLPRGGEGVALTGFAAARASGGDHQIREVSVPWSVLGVPPGTALRIQPAVIEQTSGTIENVAADLPDGVRDNGGLVSTGYYGLGLSEGRTFGAEAGVALDFPHTVFAEGNLPVTAELQAIVTLNAPMQLELWSDPNEDGDPTDGQLLATDVAGDGDFIDLGDSVTVAGDSNADRNPDTGTIAAKDSASFVVRAFVPASAADETRTILVSATASNDSSVNALTNDELRTYGITVVPSHALYAEPGVDVPFSHTVCNFQGNASDIRVGGFSNLLWPIEVRAGGVPVTFINLAAGACSDVEIWVSVPPGAAIGTSDTVTFAAWDSTVTLFASVEDTLTVSEAVVIEPAGIGEAVAGGSVFYPHTLRNATANRLSFRVESGDPGMFFWTDPNGDGLLTDSKPLVLSDPLDAFGGETTLIVQVAVDSGLSPGDVVVSSVQARAELDPLVRAQVDETTTIRVIGTFVGTFPSIPSVRFNGCSTVFAAAGPLDTADVYRMKWYEPGGALVRVSSGANPGVSDMYEDWLGLVSGDAAGTWRVVLEVRAGASWVLVPDGDHEFSVVRDLRPGAGGISLLVVDPTDYPPTGATMTLTAVLQNTSGAPFESSNTEYVVYRDLDDNGQPTPGEPYMQLDGQVGLWASNAFTCRQTGLAPVAPGGNLLENRCRDMGAMSFGAATGRWRVRARWTSTTCDDIIAERSATINVGCVGTAAANAGLDRLVCVGETTQLGTAEDPSLSYEWSPVDFLDDEFVAMPWATPLTTMTFTVDVADASGCIARDDVLVLTAAPTEADAGPSRRICEGDAIRLGTPALPGISYSWTPATGLDNPGLAQPLASPVVTTSYELSAAEGSCAGTSIAVVTVFPAPAADAGLDQPGLTGIIGPATCEPGLVYEWQPTTGLDDPTACNPNANPTTTTLYCLAVHEQATGCASSFDCVQVGPGVCPDPPDAGLSSSGPVVLGPAICDPAVEYTWTPPTGLDDPTACNPTADPASPTEYCVTARDPVSGCVSLADCVLVAEPCAVVPGEVSNSLMMVRENDDVSMSWTARTDADGGYHVYRGTAKSDLPTLQTSGVRVFDSIEDTTVSGGVDPAAAGAAAADQYLYRVLAVCGNGVTEGP